MTDPSQSSSRFSSSSAYKRADSDSEFLQRDELRAVRLQLEWFKPELIQQDEGIESTIVVFGSARLLEPETAQAKVRHAEQALAESPNDPEKRRALRTGHRGEPHEYDPDAPWCITVYRFQIGDETKRCETGIQRGFKSGLAVKRQRCR